MPGTASAVIWNGTDTSYSAVNPNGLTDRYGQFVNSTKLNMSGYGWAGTTTYLKDGWFLTALHCLSAGRNYGDLPAPSAASVNINGQNYSGTQFLTFGSADVALFRVGGWESGQLASLPGIERRQMAGAGNGLAQIGGYGRDGVLGSSSIGYSQNFHRAFNVVSLINGTIYTNANRQSRLVDNGYLLGIQGPGDSGSAMFEGNGPSDQTLDLYDWSLTGVCQTGGGETLGNGGGGYGFLNNWAGTIRDTVYANAVLNWNANAASTATATDGSGTWNTTIANFTNGTNYAFNGPTRTEQAIFGSGNGAAGTVTLTSTVPITEVIFNAAGSGNYTIAGDAGTSLFARANTRFTTNVDATISANITGGGANGLRGFDSFPSYAKVTKNGNATLTLTGNTTLASDAAFYARAGTTVIAQNGAFAPGRYTNVAAYQNETATLTVKDNAAYNAANQDFNLADLGGNGTLNVQNNASVTVGQMYVGKGFTRLSTNSTEAYSAGGTGTVNQTGGTVTASNFVSLGSNHAASNGTYNLIGGTLVANRVTGGLGSSTFNFNGGTLRPTGSQANFMSGLTSANVRTGGARFDTNGFNVTVAQRLVGATGDGGVTKIGSGTLTLAGSNNYSGATLVNAGTLAFSTSRSTVGAITIADGATLRASPVAGGSTLTSTSLTAGSAGSATLAFDLIGASTTTPYISTGAFNLNGSTNVAFTGGGTLESGLYKLVGYTSLGGTGGFASSVYALGPRSIGTLLNNGTSALDLDVVADRPIWTGGDNGNWTTAVTGPVKNWKLQSNNAATDYLQGDNVLFDDTPVGTTAVVINTANVLPAAVTFNNSTKNYTVSGGFGIAGDGTVTKTGTGTVTLSTSNSYTGGTSVSGGTLSVSADNNLGASTSPVTINGATLRTTSTSPLVNTHVITVGSGGATLNIAGNGTGTTGQGARVLFNTANTLLGSGPLTVTGGGTLAGTAPNTTTAGAGALILNAANTYAGNLTLQGGGMLEYANSAALGTNATITLGNEGEFSVTNGVTAPQNIVVSGGTNSVLSFTNNSAGIASGAIALNANLTVGLRNWYTYAGVTGGTLSGVISGAGGLTVNSGTGTGGTLTLSGPNTFTGNVTVGGAIINAANGANTGSPRTSGPLGNASTVGRTVTVNNAGTVRFTVGNVLAGGGSTVTPGLSFVVNAGGTMATAAGDIGGSGGGDANVFGNITLNGGTFTTGNGYDVNYQAAILLGSLTVGGTTASTISTNASNTTANGIMLGSAAAGAKTFAMNVPDVTTNSNVDLTISAPLTNAANNSGASTIIKSGTGTVVFGGYNTFSGDLTINAGEARAGSDIGTTFTRSNLGTLTPTANRNVNVNSGATLTFTGGNVLGTGFSNNDLANVTLNVAGGTFQTGLNGSGTGWWNKIGKVNLSGGTIRVGSGTTNGAFQGLALIGTVAATGIAPSTIENFASSNAATNGIHLGQNATAGQVVTFNVGDVTASSAADLTVTPRLLNTSGNLAASGLTKTGPGTLLLAGANTYTGPTTVNGGTLAVKYTATGTSAASPLLGGAGTNLQNGRVIFDYTGSTTPVSTIRSLLAGSYQDPTTPGVMETGTLRSTTATAARGLGYMDGGLGSVVVMATLFGDADLDGGVSINDFNALAGNFGAAVGKVWADGDFDYDGGVSINDFNLFAGGFGQSLPANSEMWAGLLAFAAAHNDLAAFEAVTGVPEPAAAGLLSIGVAAGLRRRPRRCST